MSVQFASLWLALGLAHLLGDFVLQRDAVVEGRARHSIRSYCEHGLIHFVSTVAIFLIFVGPASLGAEAVGILAAVVGVHLVLDIAKDRVAGRSDLRRRRWLFFVDQLLHFASLTIAASLLCSFSSASEFWTAWMGISNQVLVVVFGYTAIVFASGHVNAVLLKPMSESLRFPEENRKREPESSDRGFGLARAGFFIGILERFLIMTAVLAGSAAGAGLVIAAKSVFRFEDAKKDRQNAEYFLIGTFLSVAEAVLGGVIVLRLLDLVTMVP